MCEAAEVALIYACRQIEDLQQQNDKLRTELAEVRAKAITQERVEEVMGDVYKEFAPKLAWDQRVMLQGAFVAVTARLKEGK